MTNDMRQNLFNEPNSIHFGQRLKAAREAMRLDPREAAIQLRLSESVIMMLESDHYDTSLPVTFVRGYLRSYAKFLNIPDDEIQAALLPFKQQPEKSPTETMSRQPSEPVTISNYFMQFFTFMVVVTLVGLVGTWWYSHPNSPTPTIAEAQPISLPENTMAPKSPENDSVALNAAPSAPTPESAPAAPVPAPEAAAAPKTIDAPANQTSAPKSIVKAEETHRAAKPAAIEPPAYARNANLGNENDEAKLPENKKLAENSTSSLTKAIVANTPDSADESDEEDTQNN